MAREWREARGAANARPDAPPAEKVIRKLRDGAPDADYQRAPETFYPCIGDNLFSCLHCGAAVHDPDRHQTWHALTNTLTERQS